MADRNPQQFMNIYKALEKDYLKETIRIWHNGKNETKFILPVSPWLQAHVFKPMTSVVGRCAVQLREQEEEKEKKSSPPLLSNVSLLALCAAGDVASENVNHLYSIL